MALTIGGLLTEARGVLNDTTPPLRYSDNDLINAFNDAFIQARYKRPDLFLPLGLRNTVPQYIMPDDTGTAFPISPSVYPAFIYYVSGRTELREDTFVDDKRAELLLTRFTQMLLTVQ